MYAQPCCLLSQHSLQALTPCDSQTLPPGWGSISPAVSCLRCSRLRTCLGWRCSVLHTGAQQCCVLQETLYQSAAGEVSAGALQHRACTAAQCVHSC